MASVTGCPPPSNPSPFFWKFPSPPRKALIPIPRPRNPKPCSIQSFAHRNPDPTSNPSHRHDRCRSLLCFAGRSKKKSGGSSDGRTESLVEIRRRLKRAARIQNLKYAESFFRRLNNPHSNYADNFSESELQMMGLGYDRMVRFMDKDDPNLKHPYDWYKYGEYGPYAWRGVVLGDPVRGGMTDECATLIGDVKDQEEWDKVEQFDMVVDYGESLKKMDRNLGFKYFWVFVRHPRWRVSELPWQQWTLVCEAVVESRNQRLDKWSLMGRLGNHTRSLITECAAWMRPDIVYVKRPVYQCRFEPQDDFFKTMAPLLDPETEQDFTFEAEVEEGRFELCTYFGGLCRLVKVNQKAFVDDVVKAFEKLSDERKSKCLEFLLTNHPVPLLHPYTKEWKVKLEEMELGCEAPDEEDNTYSEMDDEEGVEEEEDDSDAIEAGLDEGTDKGEEDEEDGSEAIEAGLDEGTDNGEDDELGFREEVQNEEDDPRYWEEEFKNAMQTTDGMEKVVRRSMRISDEANEKLSKQMNWDTGEEKRAEAEEDIVAGKMREDEGDETGGELQGKSGEDEGDETHGELQGKSREDEGDELALRGRRAKVSREEWKRAGIGPWRRRMRKKRMPPGVVLKAAVRPFTYSNLVKEIVLTRHAILEGEIGKKR